MTQKFPWCKQRRLGRVSHGRMLTISPATLLALHLIAPWHLLLIWQCLAPVVVAIPLLASALDSAVPTIDSANATPPSHQRNVIRGFFLLFCACGLLAIGLAKAKKASETRSMAAEKQKAHVERQKQLAGKSDFDRQKEAARQWHGNGEKHKALYKAAEACGVGPNTLDKLLRRAFASYNSAHAASSQLRCLEDFRLLKWTVCEAYLSQAESGRGDKLSDWESSEIKRRLDSHNTTLQYRFYFANLITSQTSYMLKCKNFKDVPESELTNNSETDDFAKTINEVFAKSRVGWIKKRTAEGYSNHAIRKWARDMEVVSTGVVPGPRQKAASKKRMVRHVAAPSKRAQHDRSASVPTALLSLSTPPSLQPSSLSNSHSSTIYSLTSSIQLFVPRDVELGLQIVKKVRATFDTPEGPDTFLESLSSEGKIRFSISFPLTFLNRFYHRNHWFKTHDWTNVGCYGNKLGAPVSFPLLIIYKITLVSDTTKARSG